MLSNGESAMTQFWCTHVAFTLRPWGSDTRECSILFSGLMVFAMQVECLLVGFHTVLNHSVLKNSGPCKGHISKKLLLQINVPFYKITPTVSEKKGSFMWVTFIWLPFIQNWTFSHSKAEERFESLEYSLNDKCGETFRCSCENGWVVSL